MDEALPVGPTLDRVGPEPVYQQIRDWMDQQISLGVWPERYKLQAEVDLAAALNVSRGTIRRAISALIEERKLVQIHGRGTFVSSRYLEQPLAERLVSFSEELISQHIAFETHVLEQRVIRAPMQVASRLSIPLYSDVLFLRRRRLVRGTPVILLHNYVVLEHCQGIEKIDFLRYRLFEALEEVLGLTLEWAERYFEAQVASSDTASMLDIAPLSPVLFMEQLLYMQGGIPIELSNLWIRGDRFRLAAIVSRRGSTARQANKAGLVIQHSLH